MATPVSQRAYARHRGVTHRAVQKAIAAGRIPITTGGKVDPDVADRAWAANTDESKPRNSVSGTPRPERRESPAAGFGGSAPSGSVTASGYQTARALHETYRARTARLEFERLSGMLVPADEVRSQAFTTARRVRDSILALPDRLAPVLAAITDPAEIHRALAAELRQALEELSNAKRA